MGGMGASTLAKAARGYEVETTLEQAQVVIDALNATYPEGRYCARWASEMVEYGGGSFTFTQRVSGRRRGGCGYTDGRNTVFQGWIADFAGDVLFHAAEECYVGLIGDVYVQSDRVDHHMTMMPGGMSVGYTAEIKKQEVPPAGEDLDLELGMIKDGVLSPLYGARPWAFEHDGFLYEIPYDAWGPERSTLAAERLEAIIRERWAFWFPDVPVCSTAGVARRWIKDRAKGIEIKQVRGDSGWIVPMG